jgi:hypothetical protein
MPRVTHAAPPGLKSDSNQYRLPASGGRRPSQATGFPRSIRGEIVRFEALKGLSGLAADTPLIDVTHKVITISSNPKANRVPASLSRSREETGGQLRSQTRKWANQFPDMGAAFPASIPHGWQTSRTSNLTLVLERRRAVAVAPITGRVRRGAPKRLVRGSPALRP